MTKDELGFQADIFGQYLINRPLSHSVKEIYIKALKNDRGLVDQKDKKLLEFVERHPKAIGFIDAGLPFFKPYSEVRRRLYIMLAVLESCPEYHDIFLPKKRSPFYLLFVIYSGVRAVLKTLVGTILVRAVS